MKNWFKIFSSNNGFTDVEKIFFRLSKNRPKSGTWNLELVIVRAPYRQKLYGVYFRDLLSEKYHDLCYNPLITDPYVWMKL